MSWILIVIFFTSPHMHSEHFGDKVACERAAAAIRSWREEAARANMVTTPEVFVDCFPTGQGYYPTGKR